MRLWLSQAADRYEFNRLVIDVWSGKRGAVVPAGCHTRRQSRSEQYFRFLLLKKTKQTPCWLLNPLPPAIRKYPLF